MSILSKAILWGAASALSIIPAHQAFAQALNLGEVVVTANRTPTEASKAGSKVETVAREEIEEQSLPLVIDYLDRLPGISISSPGSAGAEGSLAIRGAPRRYVKTLFNGIDIGDPTNTQVQTSYQYLLSGGIDSIEVLKGSQSTLYGSDAIAGVISLSTLGGIDLGVTHLLHVEGGSFGTARASYGLRAADENARAAINITGFRTDGISAADRRDGNTERDAYENVTFDAAGEYRFNDVVSVFGSLLFIDAEAEYDDSAPVMDNPFNVNQSRQLAGRAGVNIDLMDGRLKNTFAVQALDLDRGLRSVSQFGPFDADYAGRRTKFEYHGSFDAAEWLILQYGADHERQNARVTDNFGSDTDDSFSLTGLWGQAIVEPVENLTLTGGLRHDSHSTFGDYTTYRATGSYLIGDTGARLHSSIGTGFRAPSLYELYGPFVGNTGLDPETSFSFDVGLEHRFNERLIGDLTYFMLDIDNLIQFSSGGIYEQVPGTSRHRGIEASLTYEANSWLALGGAYTYTDAVDGTGNRNIRVPRHEVELAATVRPADRWTVSTSAKIALDTVDSGNFELEDYVLVNAKLAYQATENSQFYIRAENILNQDYQTVRGFGTPGFAAFAGFQARF